MQPDSSIPLGVCHCGCGQPTTVHPYQGIRLFLPYHHSRLQSQHSKETKICACGCGQEFIIHPSYKRQRFLQGHHYGHVKQRPSSRQYPSMELRFWAKVSKGPNCWEWIGAKNPAGYGHLGTNKGKTIVASRFSYELHYGSIPDGLFVCHKCDNPGCVRPEHLFLGTAKDNIIDMINKGRQRSPGAPGERNSGAKISREIVDAIRTEHIPRKHGHGCNALAAKYGISPAQAHKIIADKSWSHLHHQ